MVYPIYLIFIALIPGLLWLFYFLRKDNLPEPKKMILKIFFLGMVSALPAALIEGGLQKILPKNIFPEGTWQCYLCAFLLIVITVALIEELAKYSIIRLQVIRDKELDEPVDLIIYMIVAALGFATLENIFIFLSPETFFYTISETLTLASFRFVSATFLHALCSGTIGYFVALSFCEIKHKKILLFSGFTIAVLLHGLYNFSIMKVEGFFKFGLPTIIILALAVFIYFSIIHLKKIKSVCKVK
jgi:protease PrsW